MAWRRLAILDRGDAMKSKSLFKTALSLLLAVLFFAMAGCGSHDSFYIRVAFIEGVPETGTVGTPLTLTATVRPAFANNNAIVWTVEDAGTTGASISGNILNAAADGIVTIRAIIANGIAEGKEYTQDFEIVFTAPKVITDIAIKTQPTKLEYKEGETLDLSGIVVTLTFDDTSVEDANFAQFAAKGIIADPAHGTALTLAHNGKPVTVTADGHSANAGNLTVSKEKVITDIAVKTQPTKLEYKEGETLDLSGIVVTLTFDDTSTEDANLSQFAAKGITADPAHGTALTLAHNGQPVNVTADGHSANTDNLTVKAAGSAVTAPSGTWNISTKTITVTAVNLNTATGQEIEYAMSASASASSASLTWAVNKLTFTGADGVTVNKTYYVYARSKENANYNAGASSVSEGISTVVIEMVSISAGTFSMGSPEDEQGRTGNETKHSVTLTKSFYMGKYQVTQAQWVTVMGDGEDRTTSTYGKGDKYPVYRINWYDAIVFCNKLSMMEGLDPVYSIKGSTKPADWGTIPTASNTEWDGAVMDMSKNGYRLPTEAEWEYACRAGTTTAYNTGSNTISDNTGWYKNNSENKTHEVGLKYENAWGLYDMHGNVWEWCWDWYKADITADNTDPTGDITGSSRRLRGGSSYYNPENLRSASRSSNDPFVRGTDLGFRVVRR